MIAEKRGAHRIEARVPSCTPGVTPTPCPFDGMAGILVAVRWRGEVIPGETAIAGIGELAPKRDTGDATVAGMLSQVAET